MNSNNKIFMIFSVVVLAFIFTGCTADVGETCNTLFSGDCVTGKCVNNTCLKSELNEPCKADSNCNQGFCIVGACRPLSKLNEVCQYNYHCSEGICKNGICQLGTKGDYCVASSQCDKGFECQTNKCVSASILCKTARFIDVSSWGLLGGLIAIILGIIGAYFGFTVPGFNITIKGIVISVSLVLAGIGLGVIGVGIFATCY